MLAPDNCVGISQYFLTQQRLSNVGVQHVNVDVDLRRATSLSLHVVSLSPALSLNASATSLVGFVALLLPSG